MIIQFIFCPIYIIRMNNKIVIENMDKYIPNKKQYIKLNDLMPDPQKHIAIIGGTGSGKSNLLLNMLKYMYFDRLYLFTKDLTKDKYELLKKMIDSFFFLKSEGVYCL